MPTKKELVMLQALPLEIKVMKSLQRIRDWVQYWGEDGVYVSFSGGKDSTVLLHLVRNIYPSVKAVFVDTGLEYPEIKEFVKTFDNVEILHPKMNFRQVIEKYGYPIISKEVSDTIHRARIDIKKGADTVAIAKFGFESKHKIGPIYNLTKYRPLLDLPFIIDDNCCAIMKKKPFHEYEKYNNKKPFIGTLASESKLRETRWLLRGCNAFEGSKQQSTPLAFWTEQDILYYIKEKELKIASVYGDIVYDSDQIRIEEILKKDCIWMDLRKLSKLCTTKCDRTGCMFCLFGMHLEKGETRMQRLHRTHPKIYDYVLGGGEFNDKGMWVPNSKGLGFKFVMDEVNRVMGKEIYRY